MTSEPTTAGRALAESLRHVGGSEWVANRVQAIEAEARAAAERDVAALVGAATQMRESYNAALQKHGGMDAALRELRWAIGHLQITADLADTAPAEPRWPSGPDAERELAVALMEDEGGVDSVGWLIKKKAERILAALQEKRDPGE